MGDFSGIDPTALQGMIKSFSSDKEFLRTQASGFKTRFANLGLDTSQLSELVTICGWLDDQLPGLQRRQKLAVAMDAPGSKLHMVNVPEPVITSAKAQADGKALADQFNKNNSGDQKAGQAYHQMALELAAHKDDPDYCSAFYANLNPVIATTLPDNLAATGSPTAGDDLKIFSHAFGTAVSTPTPAPGFDKVKQAYLTPLPANVVRATGWDRAAMMAYGDFPSDFLAKATRANGLDQFAKDPKADYTGPQDQAKALGLPQDLVALSLQNLSHNGRAAFDAVAQMGDPKNPDLQGHLELLMKDGELNSDVETALGAMIDTASGVHGKPDANGVWQLDGSYKPNYYEQNFAFCAITAAAKTKETLKFNGNFKQDMGRLAATYAPEFATAGNVMDGYDSDDSSFGAPGVSTYHELPGVNPAFHLGGADTYNFMKIFADNDTMTAPYDKAMGELQHTVLLKAAQMDKQALLNNTPGGAGNFDRASKAFGNVSRLEFDALSKVRGDMDKQEEAFREHLKTAILLPAEVVGEPELGYGATLAWRTSMWGAKEFGLGPLINLGAAPEQMEEVDDKNLELLESSRYNTASILVEAGWPTKDIPPELRDSNGHLKPFDQLSDSKDPKEAEEQRKENLGKFDNWLADQDSPLGTSTFHDKEEEGSGLITTAQADAVAHQAEEND